MFTRITKPDTRTMRTLHPCIIETEKDLPLVANTDHEQYKSTTIEAQNVALRELTLNIASISSMVEQLKETVKVLSRELLEIKVRVTQQEYIPMFVGDHYPGDNYSTANGLCTITSDHEMHLRIQLTQTPEGRPKIYPCGRTTLSQRFTVKPVELICIDSHDRCSKHTGTLKEIDNIIVITVSKELENSLVNEQMQLPLTLSCTTKLELRHE